MLSQHAKSGILPSVAKIVGGNLVVTLVQLATGFLMARWVLPGDMGIWNTAGVATLYLPILSAGVYSGLNRELPFWIGRGDVKRAEALASAGYAFSLVLAALTAILVGGVTLLLWWQGRHTLALVIAAAGTTLGVSWISSYLYTTYKTHSEFGRLSINNTIVALAGLGLMSLVWKYGFLGMLLRAPAVALFSLAALHFRRPMPVAPRWDGSRLLILTKTGVPIFLLGQASIVFFSTDRLSLVGDTRALGYYTLAIQASTAAQMIPSAFSTVVYPRLAHILGRADRAIPLWSHTRAAAVGVTLLGGVIGVLGWVVTPWVVAAFLPHYKPGVAAAQWSCLLGLAMGPCIFANIFNVIRRQDLYAVCWALGMGGFWGGRWVLGRMGGERTVVAAQSLLLGAVVLSAACVVLSLWACRVHDRVHAIRAAAAA